ncbi:MAG: hypothetical protein PVF08_09510 [Gammaproteobacteria bacterium]|jgi:hypothetical protein
MRIRAMSLAVLLPVAAGLAASETEQPQVQSETDPADHALVQEVTYQDDVAPILHAHCAECHVAGQQGAKATGFLVDSYASVMNGSLFGPVIDPGSARTSSLYILLTGGEHLTVNMPHGKDPISDEEIEIIRVWIDSGAVDN